MCALNIPFILCLSNKYRPDHNHNERCRHPFSRHVTDKGTYHVFVNVDIVEVVTAHSFRRPCKSLDLYPLFVIEAHGVQTFLDILGDIDLLIHNPFFYFDILPFFKLHCHDIELIGQLSQLVR